MILAAIFTAVFASAITQFTKRWDRKPFNCELCMTFWISLFVSFMSFSHQLDVITFVGVALFKTYLECGTFRAVENEVGINYVSVYHTVKDVKKHIKNNL